MWLVFNTLIMTSCQENNLYDVHIQLVLNTSLWIAVSETIFMTSTCHWCLSLHSDLLSREQSLWRPHPTGTQYFIMTCCQWNNLYDIHMMWLVFNLPLWLAVNKITFMTSTSNWYLTFHYDWLTREQSLWHPYPTGNQYFIMICCHCKNQRVTYVCQAVNILWPISMKTNLGYCLSFNNALVSMWIELQWKHIHPSTDTLMGG